MSGDLNMTVSRLTAQCPKCVDDEWFRWGCCKDSWHREYVYFAHIGDYVKVGFSTRPDIRVCEEIQGIYGCGVAHPRFRAREAAWFVPRLEPLHSLHVVEVKGGRAGERQAHEALWDFGDTGEWFIADPALLAWVADQEAGKPFERLTREGGEWERPRNALEEAEFEQLRQAMSRISVGGAA